MHYFFNIKYSDGETHCHEFDAKTRSEAFDKLVKLLLDNGVVSEFSISIT